MNNERATHKLDPQKRSALLEMLDRLAEAEAEKIKRSPSPDGIVTGYELLLEASEGKK